MPQVNLQVRIPSETAGRIARFSRKSKSEFVREAIVEKIEREMHRRLEEQWIHALKKHPENKKEARRWLKVEAWD